MFGKNKAKGIGGSLISGLPLSEGSFVQVNASPEGLRMVSIVGNGKQEFNLSLDKITSVRLMNEQEIRKVVEQSVPGMIIGAAAFGIIGAMIGGRVQTKEKKTLKQILLIDYTSNEPNQIVLDCSGEMFSTQSAFMKYIDSILPQKQSNTPIQL